MILILKVRIKHAHSPSLTAKIEFKTRLTPKSTQLGIEEEWRQNKKNRFIPQDE